jgi:hypothetical protein
MIDIFNDNAFPFEEERLPTFKQYIKRMNGKKLPNAFHVSKIWFPNQYPSYSLECDKFRLSVPSKSPMGVALSASVDALTAGNIALSLFVVVTSDKAHEVRFRPSKEKGGWEEIGYEPTLGYRFVQDA